MISPDICRAARYLVNLSQQELAAAAGVARSTVAEFERGARVPVTDNVTAMRKALEAAGVTFIPADDAAGPGVRLRK
ncbi:helix-turn-helix transcriptional regulator [Pelagibius litoralis]|uniref:Helix-turn-helix transcriptional regulator n=1 Tax=Pelagibius litoralis TaxID=374515 RepID=A0A967EYN5_9PROT|nr:helix-turn-helix transcriptional regulator [Pelagibius litoralis]NIA69873.1 helix-turn-helix transcriptional regulator [Pelagibius litoralis]